MKKTTVLIVLDGWGIGARDESNPIYKGDLKTIDFIQRNFPSGALQASGIAVGLPYDEEGNSEIGHLTLGAGRVVGGHLPRISSAIENGTFFQNKNFLLLLDWVYKNNSFLHLVGLLSAGEVHSSFKHLKAIINFLKSKNFENYYLHLISDGRDSPAYSFLNLLSKLSSEVGFDIYQKIASISGRYYAMDRDKHWDRTKEAYAALVGKSKTISNLEEMVKGIYEKGLNDEYLESVQLENKRPIMDSDAVFFFNFREDRMRQLVRCFLDQDFNFFPVKKFSNLLIVTMTPYDRNFKVPVIFPYIPIKDTLSEVLSSEGKTQLKIAETEKYAHVTYFFNGLREEPFPGEYRILIPSKNIFRYNEYPEMMAKPITDRLISALTEGTYDFILANYANADMVAHTGDFEATKKAVQFIDGELNRLLKVVLQLNHTCVITSDHGNAEVLLDIHGEPETKHNISPVPFYLIAKEFQKKTPVLIENAQLPVIGMLSDVSPTILDLMRVKQPNLMTGQSLLTELLLEE